MGLVLVDIFITEKRKDGGMLRGYRSSLENRIKTKKEHEMLVKKKQQQTNITSMVTLRLLTCKVACIQ